MALQAPSGKTAKLYRRHEVEGLEVYLPPGLLLTAPALTIRLGGFWKFRWLKVEGVGAPSACAL